jgi:hypothetical protein
MSMSGSLGLKLADFGLSFIGTQLEMGFTNVMNPDIGPWLSPKALTVLTSNNKENFFSVASQQSDLWDLGCLIFYIMEGRKPFNTMERRWFRRVMFPPSLFVRSH